MGSIKDLITEAKVEALQAVVEYNGQKYLCFTRLTTESWVLCVSDGFDLWRLALDMDELATHRDLAEVASIDAFLVRFRHGFSASDMRVSPVGVKLALSVGTGSKGLRFELYEAKAVEKRTELQTVLFRLAESVTDLEHRLETTSRQLETLKHQRTASAAASNTAGLFDLDAAGKKKGQPRAAPRSAGMSVVNPGSKKRKAAAGVVFD